MDTTPSTRWIWQLSDAEIALGACAVAYEEQHSRAEEPNDANHDLYLLIVKLVRLLNRQHAELEALGA